MSKKMFDCEYLHNGKKCPQKDGVCAKYSIGEVDELCRVRVPVKKYKRVKAWAVMSNDKKHCVCGSKMNYMKYFWSGSKYIPCIILIESKYLKESK